MKTVLLRVSYLIDVEDNLWGGSKEAETFLDAMDKALPASDTITIDAKHSANWNGSSFCVLDPARMNCGKCVRCGAWVTDRDKPEPVVGLTNGARVNGELLCNEHLSKEHRRAF